ncbi:MAG: hypothetical protein K0S16_679 [Moraxellaceae bacterium]|nr:hypothetical protein [Moraxellaceae bacterium]
MTSALSSCSLPITHHLGSLVGDTLVISPEESTRRLEQRFRHLAGLPVAAVVRDGHPLGIVERSYLLELFAQPYGRALNERKPVADIMQTAIVLPATTPLLEAGRHLIEISAESDELPHSIVVVDDDERYTGLVRVRELLRCITELQIRDAREASPLTGLPGNSSLARHIEAALASYRVLHVAYVDCNHFKPYNDTYGFAAGDMVIHAIGEILVQHADAQDLVAHIGGDDFMVVFTSTDWQRRCEAVLRDFRARAPAFYNQEDAARGRMHGQDRQGHDCWLPLLSLAIGVCSPDPQYCRSHLEVSALAGDAKSEAKRIGGNVLYVTRRRRPASWFAGSEDRDAAAC